MVLDEVDGAKETTYLFDVSWKCNSKYCFSLLVRQLMAGLHKMEAEKFYCLGAELAFVQADLHAGFLETLEDFVEDIQVFIKVLSCFMKYVINIGLWFVLLH